MRTDGFGRPLKSKGAAKVGTELVKIFSEFSASFRLQIDNGGGFTTHVIETLVWLCTEWKIVKRVLKSKAAWRDAIKMQKICYGVE